MNEKNKKPIFSLTEKIFIALTGTIVLFLWVYSPFFLKDHFKDLVNRGQFGDSFGVVTSLFNAFAFFALVVTLIMQRRELSYQREEFQESRIAQENLVKENQNYNNIQILLSHTAYLQNRADQIGNELRRVIINKGYGGSKDNLMCLHDKSELDAYFGSTKFNKDDQNLYLRLTDEYFNCYDKHKMIQEELFSKKTESILSSGL